MPLYVADYEADTAHLSPEEDGIYTRLLRLCWRTPGCSIPDDPDWIARMMRVTPDYFAEKVTPILGEFFKRRKARLFSPRQQREFDRIKSTSEKRSSAGKKGGRPAKALNIHVPTESPAKANEKHLELEPELKERETPCGVSGARKRARKPEIPIPENWCPSERNIADAEAKRFSQQEISHEADRFRDYHLARDTRFRDWDAAWRTWIGNARGRPNGGVAVTPFPGRGGSGRSLASIAAQRRANDPY
jgi:uncharacterized protein YdaU (DUF1376 family)